MLAAEPAHFMKKSIRGKTIYAAADKVLNLEKSI
jgi:hypothetical protein